MARVRLLEDTQHDFLNKIKEIRGVEWLDMAVVCDVHRRTFLDWRRDKYQMSYMATLGRLEAEERAAWFLH